MKLSTREWMNRAKDDLDVIEEIAHVEYLTNMVAFHAQQAIEKSLKALLEEQNGEVPRIHDLIRLCHLTAGRLECEIDEMVLKEINDVYIDGRYPGDVGLLPYGKPTSADAAIFHALAQRIYKATETFLRHTETFESRGETDDEEND